MGLNTRGKSAAAGTPTHVLQTEAMSPNMRAVFDKCLESQLDAITEKISNKIIAHLKDVISEEVNKSVAQMKECFETQINSLQNEIQNLRECHSLEVNALKSEVSVLKDKILRQENKLVSRDLRINNIPLQDNENIHMLFTKLCDAVNVAPPAVDSIFRQRQTSSGRADSDIIVKFKTAYDRNGILKAIAAFCRSTRNNLRLNILGFNSDATFYVRECLTAANYANLKLAVSLKKQNKLCAAFTRRGLVHVKTSENSALICIDTERKALELMKMQSGEENEFFRMGQQQQL